MSVIREQCSVHDQIQVHVYYSVVAIIQVWCRIVNIQHVHVRLVVEGNIAIITIRAKFITEEIDRDCSHI